MDVFSAIADPVRRDIVTLLASAPTPAGVIADAFGDISRPAVSRHLRILREAGLVRADAQGRRQVYSATVSPLVEVTDWIDRLTPRLASSFDALETEVYRARRDRLASESTRRPTDTREEQTA